MATQSRSNALHDDIVIVVRRETTASPEAVYGVLIDPRTHLEWGGRRMRRGPKLVGLDAGPGPLGVGSEFTSQGVDAMGGFQDRSVVTETEAPGVLEFVTEGRLTTKRGQVVEWTLIHRYEVEPVGAGSVVTYTVRTTRISALPGPMRLFNTPVLSGMLERFAAKGQRGGLRNLVEMAESASAA
jgi:hypothetical protein